MDGDGFSLSASHVAIVGLGLMGASLALDLRGHCAELIGVSRTPATLEYALSHHIVDRVAEFGPALDCDLLILAAPVRTITRQLESFQGGAPSASSGGKIVVLDLGSTKTEIVHAMQSLPAHFDPVGGHPMCGKEVAGIRYAESGLYQGKTFVLTPLKRTSPQALALVQELVQAIGAVPLILAPEKQDELVAFTSHLPYLLASALMKTVLSREDPQLWQVAASGFRDTSRLAASDIAMMLDILLTNRQAILSALGDYQAELNKLTAFLQDADEDALQGFLTPVQQKRSLMFRSVS